DYERRLVAARLPRKHDLDEYDYNFYEGIDRRQMKELRELVWLREAYNLILMGPSGTGKTFLAAGLVFDAVKAGYKAYLMTMEDIVNCLRLKDISTSAMMTYNKILRAQLLAIDDIMLFPVKREEATAFFNLINTLHEKTSIIITTNKAPTEWVETLNDEILASALLDRLLYRCEVIKFTGSSYRLENRQTIFKRETNLP
uniref:IS21-like element helper ATPase IstB n=1 Tax=Phocaeicola vulgatus TaxID=821 RepID=UPI003568190F